MKKQTKQVPPKAHGFVNGSLAMFSRLILVDFAMLTGLPFYMKGDLCISMKT